MRELDYGSVAAFSGSSGGRPATPRWQPKSTRGGTRARLRRRRCSGFCAHAAGGEGFHAADDEHPERHSVYGAAARQRCCPKGIEAASATHVRGFPGGFLRPYRRGGRLRAGHRRSEQRCAQRRRPQPKGSFRRIVSVRAAADLRKFRTLILTPPKFSESRRAARISGYCAVCINADRTSLKENAPRQRKVIQRCEQSENRRPRGI